MWLHGSASLHLKLQVLVGTAPGLDVCLQYAAKVNDEQRTAPICYFGNCNKARYFELLVKV